MTIGEQRNKDWSKNWQLCDVWKLSLCNYEAKKITQNCVSFTNPVSISLFCFPSLVNIIPRYLNFSTCFSVLSLNCSANWLGFLDRHNISIVLMLSFIPLYRTKLKINQMYIEGPDQRMQVAANSLQKANGWSCNFQLGCDRLSNWHRLWRGMVTTKIFVRVQHQRRMSNDDQKSAVKDTRTGAE